MYIDQLQDLHVLMETRQMLENKLDELVKNNQSTELVEDDLEKIEKEIMAYTDGQTVDGEQIRTHSLFNPAVFYEDE